MGNPIASTAFTKALISAANLMGEGMTPPQSPTEVLESLLLGQYQTSMVNGRTVISTSEAGGSVAFTLPEGMTPRDIFIAADQALDWLANTGGVPPERRRIMRLRAGFSQATP